MSHAVEVSLLGRNFIVRTQDDPEHAHAAAAMVQQRIDELRSMGAAVASDRLLALVALNLAGELLLKQEASVEGLDGLLSSLDDVVLQAKGLVEAPLR